AGTVSDHISAFWDVLPTLAELAGAPVPDGLDGISFVPTLLGHPEQQKQHEYLYWEFHERGGKQAVRKGRWKGVRLNVRRDPDGPIELYDLQTDPREEHNVAAAHPQIVQELKRIMREARTESPVFRFGRKSKR
ncbi:MAG TPA: DUF4976 domain-containing protein, partial [Planctomycetaceae bacterium]|nr:DUF4976 domain-containing protein [Planctomycetaceae bacterium]